MAKKTAKKEARSAKSGKGKKTSQPQPLPAPAEAPQGQTDAPPVPKKNAIACDFCGKPMKDARTRKIHERNCQSKMPAPDKPKEDFGAAILGLRTQFQDQVESMSAQMREREEQHQRELDEVKTVLRMEIDRHRKELERISKVEKDVAAEKQELPENIAGAEEHAQPEIPIQHAQARDRQPKAIDLVPLPVPRLPRKREPLLEEDAIPEIGEDAAARQEPVSALDRETIEEIVRCIIGENVPAAAAGVDAKTIEKIAQLSGRLDYLDQKMERNIAELQRCLDRIGKEAELKRMEKELEKVSERVMDIMEDSGYGENLNVSKIPPTILEIVYQAILDDVYIEIMKTKGPQDAERVARSALEEVRLKTSGSELFKYDGRKIVTDNLARTLEGNQISAKQIQTTYEVLLERLLETVPHHKAKNFKGMIKVKSQEFAVDRATKLTKDAIRIEKVIESTSQMVAAMSSNFNSKNLELHEAISNIRDSELASKADRADIDALRLELAESNDRCARLADELALIKVQAEMAPDMAPEPPREAPEDVLLTPGEEPFVPPSDIAAPEMPIHEDAPQSADEMAMQNEAILSAVGKGADTKTALLQETGLDEELMLQRITELVDRYKLIQRKIGKKVKYSIPEAEPEPAGIEKTEPDEEPRTEEPPPRKEKKLRKKKPAEAVEPIEDAPVEPEVVAPAEEVAEEKTSEPVPEEKHAKKVKAKKEKKPVKKAKKSEVSPEPQPEMAAPAEEPAPVEDEKMPESDAEPETHLVDLPTEKKTLDELSDDEKHVLDAVAAEGMTISGIQSKVGKHLKRFALLRALRVLIDSGHVGILTKGRMELYYKITVEKMEKTDNSKRKMEVK